MQADYLEKSDSFEKLMDSDCTRKVGMLDLDGWIILKFTLNKRGLIM
jgi:hypothetical protein